MKLIQYYYIIIRYYLMMIKIRVVSIQKTKFEQDIKKH